MGMVFQGKETQCCSRNTGLPPRRGPSIRLAIFTTLQRHQEPGRAMGLRSWSGLSIPAFKFYFGFGRRGLFLDSVENVRLVSSQIKAEYDHVFLYMRTFRFNYTENLFTFLHHLNNAYQEQLSSVELAVCTRLSMEPWLDSIAYLPIGLKHVHFRLQLTPLHWYHEQQGLESPECLGGLFEQAARKAPGAQISISSVTDHPLEPTCQAAVDNILTRIRTMERYDSCVRRL